MKSCHLKYPDGYAYFPDSTTERSIKHLRTLRRLVMRGHRASLFITVQRADIHGVRPSELHDPRFCRELRRAAKTGVEVRAFSFKPTLAGYAYTGEVPVDLTPYSSETQRRWSLLNQRHSGWNHWNSTKDIEA